MSLKVSDQLQDWSDTFEKNPDFGPMGHKGTITFCRKMAEQARLLEGRTFAENLARTALENTVLEAVLEWARREPDAHLAACNTSKDHLLLLAEQLRVMRDS